jgi:hypothetical protein
MTFNACVLLGYGVILAIVIVMFVAIIIRSLVNGRSPR